eukprot:950880-Prymnesium_polylepis.2
MCSAAASSVRSSRTQPNASPSPASTSVARASAASARAWATATACRAMVAAAMPRKPWPSELLGKYIDTTE